MRREEAAKAMPRWRKGAIKGTREQWRAGWYELRKASGFLKIQYAWKRLLFTSEDVSFYVEVLPEMKSGLNTFEALHSLYFQCIL